MMKIRKPYTGPNTRQLGVPGNGARSAQRGRGFGRVRNSLSALFTWQGTLLLPGVAAVLLSTLGRCRREDAHSALLVGLLMVGRMETRRAHAR
jgi:hypothetical protein